MKNVIVQSLKGASRIVRKLFAVLAVAKTKKVISEAVLDETLLEGLWHDKKISCISTVPLRDSSDQIDLSIVVPLFNSVPFLEKCLSSIVNQRTRYRFEVILVNDGSTDNTLFEIQIYQSQYSHIIKILDQENQGISASRNAGVQVSRGEYIGFADHDDWVAETYVEELLDAAYRENADIVKCGYATLKRGITTNQRQMESKVITGPMKEQLLQYASFIWGGIYRRELLSLVRFPVGYWYEDMITRALLFRQSQKFVNVGKVLYFKLTHSSNTSSVVWSNKKYQCLEQIYLPLSLISDSAKLSLPIDGCFYQCILLEYSAILVSRISGLKPAEQEQAFLKAHQVLSELYREEYEACLTPKSREWNRTILDKKYLKWKNMQNLH